MNYIINKFRKIVSLKMFNKEFNNLNPYERYEVIMKVKEKIKNK